MELLIRLDKKDYQPDWPVFSREAVRAVIFRDGKIALVKSAKAGFYKFPGGGIRPGEEHLEALIREAQEETGLILIPESVRPFGRVEETRLGLKGNEIFRQNSYYYFAEAEPEVSTQNLDDYEAELEYQLAWTTLEEAYGANSQFADSDMIQREAWVLGRLIGKER